MTPAGIVPQEKGWKGEMIEVRPTLLVVDDAETNIDILLEALGEDYTVRVATNGAAALISVKKALPDLILLDIMMPDMDGFEVCRRLKEDPTARDIPIIFLTALQETTDEAHGLELGAVDYITKPFNRVIIKARIRNQLELKRHRDHLEALVAERTWDLAEAHNRKTESLGRMAGAIAHHFNNQLGVVIGNLELAMMELSPGMAPPARITAAMKASNKAAEMSGLMLTYLGLSFEKHEPLDLSETCRQGLPMLQAIKSVKVVLETDFPYPGPTIHANANQILQILSNLITNAWEAVGESRDTIHLSIKTVSAVNIPAGHRFPLGWQPQNNAYACLEVTDSGCGIEEKEIENIFDPFFSSKFTGRGMGLAVVLGIVRAHDGTVTVESEPGHGSIFRVFFPISGEGILRQPEKLGNDGDILINTVSPTEIAGNGTVLLVEDEEMVRNMAAFMLTRLGFSVIEAENGVEAMEIFKQRQDEIRFVLCDLTMPHMNGWETLTALRKLAPDIPVILASGYDKAHVMSGDHPELPQAFLGKPYHFEGLSDAICQVLVIRK